MLLFSYEFEQYSIYSTNTKHLYFQNSKIEGLNLQTDFQKWIVYVLITVINLWLFKNWIIYD